MKARIMCMALGILLILMGAQSCDCGDAAEKGNDNNSRKDAGQFPFCEISGYGDCPDGGPDATTDVGNDVGPDVIDDTGFDGGLPDDGSLPDDGGDGGGDSGEDGGTDSGIPCLQECPTDWQCNPATGNCEKVGPENYPPLVEFISDAAEVIADVPISIQRLIKTLEDPDGYIAWCVLWSDKPQYLALNRNTIESTVTLPPWEVIYVVLKCWDNGGLPGMDGIMLGGVDMCANVTCANANSFCRGGECLCKDEWLSAPDCDIPNPCAGITCNHGYCDSANGTCVCPGWKQDCALVDPNTPDPCNRNGEYLPDGTCKCNTGWLPPDCTKSELEPSDFCNGHGYQKQQPGTEATFVCNCNPGWIGTYCEAEDPGTQDPCENHGVQYNGKCFCNFGYTGDACGRCRDGYKQSDEDCVPNPCPDFCAFGTCQGDICECDKGHDGTFCDRCRIGWQDPLCGTCSPGYEGPDCKPNKCFAIKCEDTDLCNGIESCDTTTGSCVNGTPVTCPNDPNKCNGQVICNPQNGLCEHHNPVTCADDTLYCDGAESCREADGMCVSSGNPCGAKACVESTHACVDCLKDSDCPAIGFCDGPPLCKAGVCSLSGNPCTLPKLCDANGKRCVDCLKNSDCADDGQYCNGPERCDTVSGKCVHSGDPCPAGKFCREEMDFCADCLIDADCKDDGQYCNGTEACGTNGLCAHSGDPCTGIGKFCSEVFRKCITCRTDADCPDDGNVCDGAEKCVASECAHVSPLHCDNGNPCDGAETCDPATGCKAGTPIPCPDDGDECNGAETCRVSDGACIHVNPIVCNDDGDKCNGEEYCVPSTGACDHRNPVNCPDDNDICNGQETCRPSDGACIHIDELDCNNGLACDGTETCDPILGCQAGTLVTCGTHQHCAEPSGFCECDSGWGPPGVCDHQCDPNPVYSTAAFLCAPGTCVHNRRYTVRVEFQNADTVTITEIGNCGSSGHFDNGQTTTTIHVPFTDTVVQTGYTFPDCAGTMRFEFKICNACGECDTHQQNINII